MTYFEQSDIKVNKKIYTIMEELFDGVDDIPMDEVRKKNIQLLRAQEKSMKYHISRPTTLTRRCLVTVSTPSIVSPSTTHDVIETRVLFMCRKQEFSCGCGVESVDHVDSEGIRVSVDADLSRTHHRRCMSS